jgi:hypothetical protein
MVSRALVGYHGVVLGHERAASGGMGQLATQRAATDATATPGLHFRTLCRLGS